MRRIIVQGSVRVQLSPWFSLAHEKYEQFVDQQSPHPPQTLQREHSGHPSLEHIP